MDRVPRIDGGEEAPPAVEVGDDAPAVELTAEAARNGENEMTVRDPVAERRVLPDELDVL